MEQLIKITTVPIEYELKIQDAQIERRRGTAEMEITRDRGGMKIKSRPVRLSIDSYDARNSVVPTTKTAIQQSAQKGQQVAYQATAQFAQEGKMLIRAQIGEGTQTINQVLGNRTARPTGDFEMGFTPSVGPEINWIPPELSIQYEMDKLNFDAKINSGNIEFIPGTIELSITQHPDVMIEYTGAPIYVPASAAEFFTGGSVDVMA